MQFAEYRANMLMVILGTYGYTGMMLVFIEVLFSKVESIAGWSKYGMMLLFATGQFVIYLFWIFFEPLQEKFSELINDGELDLYLTKPISAYWNVVSSEFNLIQSVPSIALAVGMFAYVLAKLDLTFTPLVLILIPSTLISTGIMIGLYSIVSFAAFWLTDTRELNSMQGSLLSLDQFPPDIFPKGIKALSFIFPINLLAYPQTKLLLENKLNIYLLLQPLSLITLIAVITLMWKRGLKRYSSASS